MTPSSPTPEQDVLARYFEVAGERDNLSTLLDSATELVRPVIETALQAADAELTSLESQKRVRQELTAVGEQVAASLSQIDALASAVELGLIKPEVVEAQREAIISDERSARALDFMKRAGLLEGAGVSVEKVPEPKTSKVPAEQKEQKTSNPEIVISIHGNGVRIGTRGKFVRLAGAGVELRDQRDYSEERKKVLKVLVENAGTELSATELWEAAFPGEELDRNVIRQIKNWFEGLTYRGVPIIVHNGKRGPGSAYSIPNPNVRVAEVVTTKSAKQAIDQESVAVTSPAEIVSTQTAAVDAQLPVVESPVEVKKAPVFPVKFPLSQAESAILAEFLDLKRDLLEAFDIPVIDPGISDKIHEGLKTTKIAETMAEYGGDVSRARKSIISKVHEYFMDEDMVMDDITNMSERDYRYGLFEYLFTFDYEDRVVLLEKLATSVPVTEISMQNQGGVFSSGVVITGTEMKHVDDQGNLLLGDEDVSDDESHAKSLSVDDQASDTPIYFDLSLDASVATSETDGLAAEDAISADDVSEIDEDDASATEESGHARSESTKPEWLVDFIAEVHDQISLFEEDGLMTSADGVTRKVMNVMSSSTIMGTDENLRRGVANGIIKQSKTGRRNEESISMSRWICLALQNANPQIFTNRTRRRQAIAAVEEIVAGYFAARERKAAE